MFAVPLEPMGPCCDIAQLRLMSGSEFECEAVLAEGDISVELVKLLGFLRDLGICAPDRTLRRHDAHPSDDAYRRRKRARP